jgi:hypothetical protein
MFSTPRPTRIATAQGRAYRTTYETRPLRGSRRGTKPASSPYARADLRGVDTRDERHLPDKPVPRSEPPDLLTAQEAAQLLRVRREWVYAYARELGGWRLLGERGPWRFSRRRLQAPQSAPSAPASSASSARPRERSSTVDAPLRRRPRRLRQD